MNSTLLIQPSIFTPSTMTPWGESDHCDHIADGIVFHSTPSHGGIELSKERAAKMPVAFRQTFVHNNTDFPEGHRWYEEDCDYPRVVVVFPDCFPAGAADQAGEFLDRLAGYGDFPKGWRSLLPAG